MSALTRQNDINPARTASSVTPSTVTPQPDGGKLDKESLGLIIPLSAFSFCMLVVVACLIWYSLRCKSIKRGKEAAHSSSAPNSSFRRSLDGELENWEEWRSSCRSTTPLRQASLSRRPDFLPRRLAKISESPEDRLAQMQKQEHQVQASQVDRKDEGSTDDNLASQEDSILAMVSKWRLPSVSGSMVQYEDAPRECSQSYPSLVLPAQPPFSPYHITWLSPLTSRNVQSDPSFFTSHKLNEQRAMALARKGSIREHMKEAGSSESWKSPYHPNYNTPTGSEGEGNALPSNTVINTTRAFPNQHVRSGFPNVYPQNLHNIRGAATQKSGSVPIIHSCHQESSTASEGSATFSSRSQVGSWHYNNAYRSCREPCPYEHEPCCPCSDITYVNPAPLCPCQGCQSLQNFSTFNASTYPIMGSSTNTSATTNQMTQSSLLPTLVGYHSANTSTCAMMDSGETTQSGIGQVATETKVKDVRSSAQSTLLGNSEDLIVSTGRETLMSAESGIAPASSCHSSEPISMSHLQKAGSSGDKTDSNITNPFSSTAQSTAPALCSFEGPRKISSTDRQTDTKKQPKESEKSVQDWNEYLSSICEQASQQKDHVGKAEGMSGDERAAGNFNPKEMFKNDVFSPLSKTDSSIQSVSLSPYFPQPPHNSLKDSLVRSQMTSVATTADQSQGSDNQAFEWDANDLRAENGLDGLKPNPSSGHPNPPVLAKDTYWI